MEKECNLIQDLLPNYIENLTSEKTNKQIENHIEKCQKCQEILNLMKDKTDIDISKIRNKKANYLKKYSFNLKFLQVVLLTILIIFIGNIVRKFVIVNDLYNKSEEIRNLDNFYIKSEMYSNSKISEFSTRTMSIYEAYYKEGNFIENNRVLDDKNIATEFVNYKYGNEELALSRVIENNIHNEFRPVIVEDDYFDKKEVKPFSIFDNYSPLYISIFMDVEKIDDNGNKYYLIRNEFSDYYIDSKTGLVIKITDISQSSISDLYYVFGTVENNDINRPDV